MIAAYWNVAYWLAVLLLGVLIGGIGGVAYGVHAAEQDCEKRMELVRRYLGKDHAE